LEKKKSVKKITDKLTPKWCKREGGKGRGWHTVFIKLKEACAAGDHARPGRTEPWQRRKKFSFGAKKRGDL